MRIALAADAYPPARTSAAVQIRDLARELAASGHRPTVIVPTTGTRRSWLLEDDGGVEVLRIRAPRTKDIGTTHRALAESLLPFAMIRGLSQSPLAGVRWDGVVWYSPTIFLGPLVRYLKRGSDCRSYLILRDLFPDWAVDTGVLRKGMAYRLLKLVERYQYSVADVIGVQTPANLPHLRPWNGSGRRVEVLNQWMAASANVGCSFSVERSSLAGRVILVYAGNMGAAQGMDALMQLAWRMRARRDVGFLFVGRGSEVPVLRAEAVRLGLDNVEFHDEIEPWEVPGLLAQCHVGLVALDIRHTTHNVPGKFLTYLQAGLPVLARVNPGNDLESLIVDEGVGYACTDDPSDRLQQLAEKLIASESDRQLMSMRGRELAVRMFSVRAAAEQIIEALHG